MPCLQPYEKNNRRCRKLPAPPVVLDYGECVHDPVIAFDGKVVDSGQLSFETDENGEVEPVLLRDNKCIMHDVKYWMPLPNVEYHPYHGEIVK